MAEPFTIGGVVTAAILFRPSAREHERLKTIAYTANKYHDSPEAARNAFFTMANADNAPAEGVDRVDSLPPAHVRPASPIQPPDNFAQNPIPVNPGVHQQAGDHVPPGGSSHNQHPRTSLLPRYLPEHCRNAIDKKWTAKKAKQDARHNKQCDKLNHKYVGTEAKRDKKQQKLDYKHKKKAKSLELRHCMEISMGEWKARRKAERKQLKGLSTKNALPAEVHASTDGTGEQHDRQWREGPRLSSRHHSNRTSSSDGIFSYTETGWQPTSSKAAATDTKPLIVGVGIGGGAPFVASMAPTMGGSACSAGC